MDARIIEPADLSVSNIGLWHEFQLAANDVGSPFFCPEFALAVGNARSDARVAILSSGRRVVGFLPFHQRPFGVAKPIGGPISDYQGPILAPDIEIDAATLLRVCQLQAFDFNHAPISMRGLRSGAAFFASSPAIDLGAGFAAYKAERMTVEKASFKDTDRCRRRLIEEKGSVCFEMHDSSDAALSAIVAFKTASYARLGIPSGFAVPWVNRALAGIRARSSASFACQVSVVRVGGRIIAGNIGMRSATTLAWWFSSYDVELRNRAPGLILLLEAAERASEAGIRFIDFGRGDEPYKLVFANTATQLCEGSIELPRSLPGALRRAQKLSVNAFAQMPLGRYESWPRRALNRLVGGVRLPDEAL